MKLQTGMRLRLNFMQETTINCFVVLYYFIAIQIRVSFFGTLQLYNVTIRYVIDLFYNTITLDFITSYIYRQKWKIVV